LVTVLANSQSGAGAIFAGGLVSVNAHAALVSSPLDLDAHFFAVSQKLVNVSLAGYGIEDNDVGW
jgi:hypothetical protein